jgi:hypothetical protein
MLMRYAMLVGVAAGAVWAAVNLGTSNADVFLVDAGQGTPPPANLSLWVLGVIAAFITFSLCRFVIFGLPSMADNWYRDNKSWLFMVMAGGLIYGVFYLM